MPASFPTTFDPEFIDSTRVFVLGNGEATTSDQEILAKGTDVDADLVGNGGAKEWFIFRDTFSGKSYAAHSTPLHKCARGAPMGNARAKARSVAHARRAWGAAWARPRKTSATYEQSSSAVYDTGGPAARRSSAVCACSRARPVSPSRKSATAEPA